MKRRFFAEKYLPVYALLLSALFLFQPTPDDNAPPIIAPPGRPAIAGLAALPLTFLPNYGQYDPQILMESRPAQGVLRFARDEVTLVSPQTAETVLRWRFVNPNPGLTVSGAAPLPGLVNFYSGSNPAAWRSGLPTYAAVTYRQLYPGVDLTYDGSQGLLKGTFIIQSEKRSCE